MVVPDRAHQKQKSTSHGSCHIDQGKTAWFNLNTTPAALVIWASPPERHIPKSLKNYRSRHDSDFDLRSRVFSSVYKDRSGFSDTKSGKVPTIGISAISSSHFRLEQK